MQARTSWRVALAIGVAAACVVAAILLVLSRDPATLSRLPAGAVTTSADGVAAVGPGRRSRIDRIVATAKGIYGVETRGSHVHAQLRRVARDSTLLSALARGDRAGAQAEAARLLIGPINHFAHVTRISVIRGSSVLVNAIVNSEGSFVVAPAKRVLRVHGRPVGTLLVSIQDVIGFIKLVHGRKLVRADVVVRGGSGQVRSSLPSATTARLPRSGRVTIAGRRYIVRSFRRLGWGNEPLTIWILESA